MQKAKKILTIAGVAFIAALVAVAPTFAAIDCKNYPGLKITEDTKASANSEYPILCVRGVSWKDAQGEKKVNIFGKTTADCAQGGSVAANPEKCKSQDLNIVIQTIINTIIFVIGMVSVFMIILGGVYYTTSQGDAAKVKKGKDTILYGIIGLVISILAFAIVNFVLQALSNGGNK